ncbi:Por secretion system C-terminal sorting domain-containing protein [Reichenbachiella agariperforans]|uniref:Por secretion system C-terminal sorting domain-containing protein n=1 Tax=Reichenbachiella agariperforans TaxID=156994 RepID=A0A1M6JNM1_REIAG|nr:Por secretion system C-terminal sorting domain-containing protein [Reichenbachiella agariperforans]
MTAEDGVTIQDWLVTVTVEAEEVLSTSEEVAWSFYPNPVHDILKVKSLKEVTVYVMDLNGHQVLSAQKGTALELDVSGLGQGVYLLIVQDDKRIVSHKIVKEN